VVVVKFCDRRFDVLVLGFEGADAIAHEHGVDAGLDRGELALDALIEVRELAGEALTLVAVSVLELADVRDRTALSNTKRAPRSNSGGYFRRRAIRSEDPLSPGHDPGFKVSAKQCPPHPVETV
jgi:hypothetical protein